MESRNNATCITTKKNTGYSKVAHTNYITIEIA